jgi:1-acyl-sn-glycerol-3-phosphate acyltransferase
MMGVLGEFMLAIIRFVLLIPYLMLVFLAGIVAALFRPRHPDNVWLTCQMVRPGLKLMGIKSLIQGREHLKELKGPMMIVSNHQNNLDIFPASLIIPRRTVSVGKKSIRFIPIFGQLYWLSGNLMIDRAKRQKAMKQLQQIGENLRQKKMNLWVLPEGTRSRGRGLLPFKKGAFITAIENQLPIVPICFSSYHKHFKWNKWKSGVVVVKVLPPISTVGLKKEQVQELIDKTYKSMQQTIELMDVAIKNNALIEGPKAFCS